MSLLDLVVRRQFRDTTSVQTVATRATSPVATGNVTYYSPNQVSVPDWDATSAVANGYLANVYVHKCVRRIAEDLASLPFKAGTDPNVPAKFNVNAPLARLLGPPPRHPNNEMSARQLWIYAVVQYLVTGKFAWWIERDNAGQVSALWPLVSQYILPIYSDGGPNYFKEFRYGVPGTTAYKVLSIDEVVYIYRPSASNVKQAESVLEAARIDVSVAQMIDQFEYNFYKNNAVPSHLIVTPPFAEPESRRAFADQFRSEYGGYQNAGKTMFLESGYGDEYGDAPAPSAKDQVVVTQLGTNAEDAQTASARDSHIQDICVAFGVPLSVLGDSTHSKFQNADMDERNYWRHTMLPLLVELADQINLHLAPLLGGEFGFFDTGGVAALSPEKTIKPAEGLPLVLANVMTRDELRGMHGLGPYSDVDPSNAPVVTPAGLPGVKATPTDDPASDDADPVPTPTRSLDLRHAGHEGHLPIPGGHLHDGTSRKDQVKAWEVLLTDSLKALIGEQRTHVLAKLSGRRARRTLTADAVFDAGYWTTRTRNLLTPIYAAMTLTGATGLDATRTADELTDDVTTGLTIAVAERDSDGLLDAIEATFHGRAENLAASILSPLRPTHVGYDSAAHLLTELSAGTYTVTDALKELENAA